MRLIDADKLRHELIMGHDLVGAKYTDLAETVNAIPLDKPFCKMVYGDYVCYNRNWLMKHLPMELDILQGKAIPIEWLQKKYDKWKDRDMLGWSYCVKLLIEEWEKENDKDSE